MILTIRHPRKISVFIAQGAYSAEQVRARTGADVVINGGLYDMKTMKPVCHLRVDGTTYAADSYHYNGYGWKTGTADLKLMDSFLKNSVDNYFCCSMMIEGGYPVKMVYDAATGGSRGNTAIGRLPDGSVVVDVHADTKADKITPEALQKEMLDAGCVDAMRLDGGGSSQISAKVSTIASSRRVHNYICVWGDVDMACPYKEPTANIRLLSVGEGAKWVQWHLNRNGASLTVDGIFGPASVKALKAFQSAKGLEADGVCGPATRTALKNGTQAAGKPVEKPAETPTVSTGSSCPYTEPVSNLKKGCRGATVQWLQWHLVQYGYKIAIDGDFGPGTQAALVDFQRRHTLDPDGICGPATRRLLKSLLSRQAETTAYQKELTAKREAMLDYLEKRWGDIYVYGSQGEIAGDTIIDWSARTYPSITTPTRVQRMKEYLAAHKTNKKGETIRAFDCSGLFWAAENAVELPLEKGKDVDDSTAATLYNTYCVPIKKEELKPLDLVFSADLTHMAIVGRNGWVHEAAGTDIGVLYNPSVDTRVLVSLLTGRVYVKSAWAKFGRLKIFYDAGL